MLVYYKVVVLLVLGGIHECVCVFVLLHSLAVR